MKWFERSQNGLSRLQIAIVFGGVLVLVPAAFTIFPELADLGIGWRVAIVVIWVAVVVAGVRSAALREQRIDNVTEGLTQDRIELRRQLETTALAEILRVLLDPQSHLIPESYEFTVYVFDPIDNLLKPVFPAWLQAGDDVRIFEPGLGATGVAWESGDFVVVKGDAVSNQMYGLTPQQQERWQEYQRSISYPLLQDLTDPIGALTALSKEEDDFFDQPAGRALFERIANIVALILLRVAPTEPVAGGS